MSRFEIRIAGLGGQGVVTAGMMIGRAASIFAGRNVTMTRSYGPESRGGASKVEVIVADDKIDYPKLTKPNLVAVMSQQAYRKNIDDLNGGAIVIIDPDMVQEESKDHLAGIYRVPATSIAEKLGKRVVANMVMVGAIVGLTSVVDASSLEKAIKRYVPRGSESLNIDAFRHGYDYVRGHAHEQVITTERASS